MEIDDGFFYGGVFFGRNTLFLERIPLFGRIKLEERAKSRKRSKISNSSNPPHPSPTTLPPSPNYPSPPFPTPLSTSTAPYTSPPSPCLAPAPKHDRKHHSSRSLAGQQFFSGSSMGSSSFSSTPPIPPPTAPSTHCSHLPPPLRGTSPLHSPYSLTNPAQIHTNRLNIQLNHNSLPLSSSLPHQEQQHPFPPLLPPCS